MVSPSQVTPSDVRERLLRATLACVERWGLTKTSVEDIAREAGCSRATVYRHFPGGREELVRATVEWEVDRFFRRIEARIAEQPDLASKLRVGLVFGHRAIREHELLQRVLRTEPDALLEELSQVVPTIEQLMRTYLLALLRAERLQLGIDVAAAADYLMRLFLSYLGSPGRWDLTDDAEVDRLVRTQFLAGIISG